MWVILVGGGFVGGGGERSVVDITIYKIELRVVETVGSSSHYKDYIYHNITRARARLHEIIAHYLIKQTALVFYFKQKKKGARTNLEEVERGLRDLLVLDKAGRRVEACCFAVGVRRVLPAAEEGWRWMAWKNVQNGV